MYSFINDSVGCMDCRYYESNCQKCENKTTCSICSPGYIMDYYTKKCMKCHSSCSDVCSNCRCINDSMYSLVDEVIGCRNCLYFIPKCSICLNITVCSKCDQGYVIDETSKQCEECHPTCLVCSNCDCTNDKMYNFVSKYQGCKDCSFKVPNCKNCTNKELCNECNEGYILYNNKCINTRCAK